MLDPSAGAGTVPTGRVLVVDDDPAIVEALRLVLEGAGYRVSTAGSGGECLETIAREPCDLVLLDLMLPDRHGLDVLKDILRADSALPVVMLTAFGKIRDAVKATRLGAANFLTKPWNNTKLLLEIGQALERRRLEAENARLREQLGRPVPGERLVGQSRAMLRVSEMMDRLSRTSSTVLILGESGTGKDLVARCLHDRSDRAGRPFVTVNSGRIPRDLLDSSLFGHLKGSFPGAARDRRGCFEIADGGTLFLDDVATLSPETQSKLLRVIQEREFVRVGSNDPVRVDVRIIAATNEDLGAAAKEGRFRQDLYYRLNVVGIDLPPLRERMDDVPLLVEEFLTRFCRREKNHFLDQDGNSTLRFTAGALNALMAHDWPGNVRELRNAVERAVVLARDEELGSELLPPTVVPEGRHPNLTSRAPAGRRSGVSLSEAVEQFERSLVTEELKHHGFNQTETAKALRVPLSTLNQKIQRLGIDVKRQRAKRESCRAE